MVAKKIAFLFLVLLITAISFSPRFSFGLLFGRRSLDIRIEDIIFLVGLVCWILYVSLSGKNRFTTPPLFWPIVVWLSFGIFSILFNLLLREENLELPFFYFLKEVEFFLLYLFIFYCLDRFAINGKLIKYWIIFYLINIIWLVYVFIFKVGWSIYYGPNIFAETKGPFPSGGYFLVLFIFLFNLFIFYYSELNISLGKKIILFFLCVAPIVGIVSSGSVASFIGLSVSLFLSLCIYFISKKNAARFIKIICIILLITIVMLQLAYNFNLATRLFTKEKLIGEYSSDNPVSRIGIFRQNIAHIFESSVINLFIGVGVWGEAHSQYIRVLLERGFIGLVLFAWLMGSLLLISYRGMRDKSNLYKKGLSAGLFVATLSMLVMAVPNDVFMVVKVDEVYWFFTAMAMAAIVAPVNNNAKIISHA